MKQRNKKIINIIVKIIIIALLIILNIKIFNNYNMKEIAAIGIIGGVNGPTTIFLGYSLKDTIKDLLLIISIISIIILIMFDFILLMKNKLYNRLV